MNSIVGVFKDELPLLEQNLIVVMFSEESKDMDSIRKNLETSILERHTHLCMNSNYNVY